MKRPAGDGRGDDNSIRVQIADDARPPAPRLDGPPAAAISTLLPGVGRIGGTETTQPRGP